MKNIFTQHPQSVNESYWQHFKVASSFGSQMFFAGLACMLHALLPFLFVKTGSDCLQKLHAKFQARQFMEK